MAIQIRRGTQAQWNVNKSNIVVGEPAITTDTENVYVGTGNGTFVELATQADISSLDGEISAVESDIDTINDTMVFFDSEGYLCFKSYSNM